ncbi:AraC family transcriptional regulator [Duncaniella sp.]|uniref:AraC family transcriptional regulator n=1 Tax=Duncaniella sp. TaxID=2518496 RepID=UPI0023BE14EE|nr:AraC family transcriptional regulator [Duncaniella sp.]MDE5904965.1 AraC family transcriptional regulator [Duncaniella sp.]MDE7147158.1 AraC family transcriptional regulator [Duncaniella sp.]
MNKIITEITPLSEKDCFYLIDRYKDRFTYPIHRHEEYELNFVSNCDGARRVVGDSIERLGMYDLVLIGNGIEHGWEQHECMSDKIREITIQFSSDLFGSSFLAKTQLSSIRRMLDLSSNGIAFTVESIMRVYHKLDNLTKIESGFYRMLELMSILYELAEDGHYRKLSSSSFASLKPTGDSRRVQKVQDHINKHYKEDIRLNDLADLVGMTPTAFSRFFKLRTGRSISDYVIDIRLGHASRQLVDSTTSVAEICYECGFNNVSNFNRIFKKKKGNSPKVFREIYQHHKMLV